MGLRNAARGLGTALTYIGQQGIEEQQRQAADRRLLDREMAFERFRSGVRQTEADAGVKREIGQYEATTPLVAARERATLTEREPFAAREDERTMARETARDARETRQEETRDARELRQEIARENRATAREEATERRRLEREGDAVVDRYVRDDDRRVLVTRSGREIVLEGRVRRSGSDDDLFDEPETPEAPTGGRASTPRQPARSTPAPNTYTDDDVQATMRARRMTRDQAVRAIEARGYRRLQ